MIRYSLKCDQGHDFESWFKSSSAFDTLQSAGHVACVVCGSAKVEKTLMTPKVATARSAPLREGANEAEQALQKMRKEVEENSDYVGLNFAAEARAIHDGDKPNRSIYGEAKPEEAKALIEDGIPVAPLPFMPKRNTN